MRIMKLLVGLLVVFLLSGCELESYEDYRTPTYDGEFTWTEVTPKAQWCNRWDHSALYFDGSLWVMGGYNLGEISKDPYLEDVWSSEDGESWTQETDNAPWLGRRGHASVVFDDGSGEAMFVIGGFEVDEESGYRQYTNDVWKSVDGANWEQVKPRTCAVNPDSLNDWYPRFNHACVVANHGGVDYIYLMGGATMLDDHNSRYSMVYFNDVWRSTNGVEWEKLNNNDYGIRSEHAATVDPATGRIFIQGGMHGVIYEGENYGSQPLENWHFLWSSLDGVTWEPEKDFSDFNQAYLWRAEHQMFMYNDVLFAMPGKSNSTEHFHFARSQDVTFWKRFDSEDWMLDSNGSDFDARYGYAVVQHDSKVWVLGGVTNSNGQENDVWYGEIE